MGGEVEKWGVAGLRRVYVRHVKEFEVYFRDLEQSRVGAWK